MRYYFSVFLLLFSLTGCTMQRPEPAQPANHVTSEPYSYYFPEGKTCTLMTDFQAQAALMKDVASNNRRFSQALHQMLSDYQRQGVHQCVGATRLTMVAVLINGRDNYGRPDFPNRTELFRLEGPSSDIQALGTRNDWTVAMLRQKFGLTFSAP